MAEDPPEEPEAPEVSFDDEASLRIDALCHDVERERGDKEAALRYVEGLEDRFAELSQEHERLGEESIRTGTHHREMIEEVLDQAAGLAGDLALERGRLAEAKAETQAVSDRDRTRVEELLDEAAQLAIELAESRKHTSLLTDERDDRDVQLRQLQVDTQALTKRSKAAEKSVGKLQAALRRAADVHAEQLGKAAELHGSQLEQIKSEAQEQEAERTTQSLETAHSQANRQLEAATKTERKLAEDLDTTRTKLAASRQEVGGLTAELTDSRQQLEQGELAAQQLQHTNNSQATALQHIQETGAARATELADVKAKFGTLQAEASGVRERLRLLTDDHDQITLGLDQSQLDTQQARQEAHTLTLDFERSQTEVADLSGQLHRAASRAQDADNRTHALQAELETGQTDLQSGAAQLSEMKSRLGQLESELMSARAQRASEEASTGDAVAAEVQTLHEKNKIQASALKSWEREAEVLGHAAEDREREVDRLTARLAVREAELEAQRQVRKDLEARLTETLARLGKSEDLVEEARMLESQRIEAPAEAGDEPPVHHDPEAERHIAWLQTELVRANRDGDRRLEDLTATVRRAEQQLEAAAQQERALEEQLRSRGVPADAGGDDGGEAGGDAQDGTDKAKRGRRLRPPRW